MTGKLTTSELVVLAESDRRQDVGRAYRYLQERPSEARPVLDRLALSRKADVRSWAAHVAQLVLSPVERTAFLAPLATDTSGYVREEAITGIAEVNIDAAGAYLPEIRRWLSSEERRTLALRLLVSLNDSASIPAIRKLAARDELPTYARRDARLAVLVLEGRASEVLDMIKSHSDHDGRYQLAGTAMAIATREAIEAMRLMAANAPDDECRRTYSDSLRELDEQHVRGRVFPTKT